MGRWAATLVLAVVVAACGAPAPSGGGQPTGQPVGLELRYTCGTFAFEPSFFQQVGRAEQGPGPIAAALRAHLAQSGPDFDFLPDSGWVLAGADATRAEMIAHRADGSLVSVSLENGPNGWRVSGWGDCQPQLRMPPNLGEASWTLDPEEPVPDPRTRIFTALVTERDCASGRPSVGRVVGPLVLLTADRVFVAFGVTPLGDGMHTCQGNPSTPTVVDLGEPLGNRLLIDASSLPHVDVREVDPLGL